MNFNVVILIEMAANELRVGYFAIPRNDELPRHGRFELRSAASELGLCHYSIVIIVELGKLRRVPDGQRQCRLQAVRA